MSANHLLIGLGGTGGKILRSFRKTLYQEFRDEPVEGVSLGYIYVDSSDEMMGIDDPSWKILGTSVQLNKNSQLLITDANLKARLDNIQNFPGIKPWIGNRDQWNDILGSIIGATLGGQKRRLGRFLFACKAREFCEAVQRQARTLQVGGSIELTFHICCGLAGGTGSGSLIDVIALIRDNYPDSKTYRIIVYAMLPDTFPNPGWDTGNYHANGYASLLELNALSVGRYRPFDVRGVKERLILDDPFNGCYVFTNENENGLSIDVDKEMPNVIADFLNQKIITAKDLNWPTLGRMENAENGDASPETGAGSKTLERSKRFLTFGIKRLAIPEEEISEYLTYNFARQAALQLRFNNWSDTVGFSDQARNQDFDTFVRDKETQLHWLISDDHLILSSGILPEDIANKKWRSINQDWQAVIPEFKQIVRESGAANWLDELGKLCEKRFDQDYRGMGVREFYKAKLRAKKEHAREIRRNIEQELFGDWRNGAKSMFDLSNLLTALLSSLDERLTAVDDKVARAKSGEEDANHRAKGNLESWAKMGPIGRIMGRDQKLLDGQALCLQEVYIYRTRLEALTFCKQLVQELVAEITDLKGEVDRASGNIGEAVKLFDRMIAERCTDEGQVDLRQHLVRFYDPQLVKRVTGNLIKDESEQHTQTGRVRLGLVNLLGNNPTFALFNQRVGVSTIIDMLGKISAENARTAHNNLVQNPKEKLLGVNIVEKLWERYDVDRQGLKTYVDDLVSRAGTYLMFEPLEVQNVSPGIPVGVPTKISAFTILLPKAQEHSEFSARLKETFRGGSRGDVEIVETDNAPHEVTLISITNLFPLRYVKQVAFLRQKYLQRISSGDVARAKLELHTEGDGSGYPSLYVPDVQEIKKEAPPFLLLAKVLGLIQPIKAQDSQKPQLILLTKDEYGFDRDPVALGGSLDESLDRLNLSTLDLIKGLTVKLLNSNEYAENSKRIELQRAVLSEVEMIKKERNNNPLDPVYKRFNDGGRDAVKILRQEV